MIEPLAPNRIHSLPVHVSYHLQSSSQTFSALFASTQQVYVHPNPGSQVDGQNEAWGAIYLKTVVQGVMMASPELHPAHPGASDMSVYVLDPRETYLRRSRDEPHLPSSPSSAPPREVWTGRGLVSWALEEPVPGKTLITGRIVRRTDFVGVTASVDESLSSLEALAAPPSHSVAEDGQAWGIEISLGIKAAPSQSWIHPLPLHALVENGLAASQANGLLVPPTRIPSSASKPRNHASILPPRRPVVDQRPLQYAPSIGLPRITTPIRPYYASNPPSSAASSSSKPPTRTSASRGRQPKRKREAECTLSPVDMNARYPIMNASQPMSTPSRPGPNDGLPMAEDLTQDNVQEILKNGAFLQMFQDIASGVPLTSTTGEGDTDDIRLDKVEENEDMSDTTRLQGDEKDLGEMKCYNCSTTRSSVWRMKKINKNSTGVRVCNACGLWYNKTRTMRPPELWATEDQPIRRRPRTRKNTETPAANTRATTLAAANTRPTTSGPANKKAKVEGASAGNAQRGLKRTMTLAVEKDAQRIADKRQAPPNRRGRPPKQQPVPMTSPSMSAPKSQVRNAKFATAATAAASSPGGWALPLDIPASPPASMSFKPFVPVSASPRESTTIVGDHTTPAMSTFAEPESPSMMLFRIIGMGDPAMPFRDDANAATSSTYWNTDSLFHNVDGFATTDNAGSESDPHQRFSEVNVSSVLRSYHAGPASQAKDKAGEGSSRAPPTSDDDVYSPLFQRTSSLAASEFEGTSADGDKDKSGDQASRRSTPFGDAPFNYANLPPSSPPGLPSNLPHSALLLSSPSASGASPFGASPFAYSPSETAPSDTGKDASPPRSASRLRHEIDYNEKRGLNVSRSRSPDADADDADAALQQMLSKLKAAARKGNRSVAGELRALLDSFDKA